MSFFSLGVRRIDCNLVQLEAVPGCSCTTVVFGGCILGSYQFCIHLVSVVRREARYGEEVNKSDSRLAASKKETNLRRADADADVNARRNDTCTFAKYIHITSSSVLIESK